MTTTLELDDAFVEKATLLAVENHRSLGQQIQYMAMIGQIAIDNPTLSFAFIEEALRAKNEMEFGEVSKYLRRG